MSTRKQIGFVAVDNPLATSAVRWLEFTIPYSDKNPEQLVVNGQRAFKLRNQGEDCTLYGVTVTHTPKENGEVTSKFPVFELGADEPEIAQQFIPHPLIVDKPEDIMPIITVTQNDADIVLDLDKLEVIENNAVRQVFFLRHKKGDTGFFVDTWLTMYSMTPAVRVQTEFSFCDHQGSNYNTQIEEVVWQFGEDTWSDFALAEGFDIDGGTITWTVPRFKDRKEDPNGFPTVSYATAVRFDGFLFANADLDELGSTLSEDPVAIAATAAAPVEELDGRVEVEETDPIIEDDLVDVVVTITKPDGSSIIHEFTTDVEEAPPEPEPDPVPEPEPEPEPEPTPPVQGELTEMDLAIIDSIMETGPLHGVYTWWPGRCGPLKKVTKWFPNSNTLAEDEIDTFEETLLDPGTIFRARRFASKLRPSEPGTQMPFGGTKAAIAYRGQRSRFIRALCFDMADEALRPVHYREPDGSPVLFSKHPDLITWARTMHSGTKDRLGKEGNMPRDTHDGRHGHVETHVASYLNDYIRLTADYQAEQWLVRMLNAEFANVRTRNGWVGPARAQGRVDLFFSKCWMQLPEFRKDIEANSKRRYENMLTEAPFTAVSEDAEVRVINILKDARWMTDEQGNPTWAWSPWEHARAALGYYAMYTLVSDPEMKANYKKMAYMISRSITAAYYQDKLPFSDTISWRCPYVIRYYKDTEQEGDLPALSNDSPDIKAGISSWETWSHDGGPAVYLSLEEDKSNPLVAKAERIIEEMPEPDSWLDAEWRTLR